MKECKYGAIARVRTVAMLPSMTLSKVDGMPNGLKLSASRSHFGFGGSKTVPSKAVGLQLRQISSKWVVMASAAVEGRSLHAA